MKKPSRLDYAYAVGRVRSLEKKLISRAVFQEAAEESDFSQALKALFDAGSFLDVQAEIRSPAELDEFIESEERNLDQLIYEILIEGEIFQVVKEEFMLEKVLSFAQSVNYAFIIDYVKHRIDLGNLKIFSRVKYKGLPIEKLESQILRGGFIDERILLQSFDLSLSEIGEKLRATPYREVWNRAIDVLTEKETFVEMECGFESFLMKYLQKAKYIVFGPEPIFAYALAKKRELNLVRLLGLGKMNQIPTELLKARISETYV